MPLSSSLRKLLCCTAGIRQEEEADAPARPPLPEAMAAGPGPAQAGRPYRDFVEREAERFRQEIENDGSPDEPGLQEAAVALPALSRAQRSSPGPQAGPALTREHLAVIAMHMRLVKRGWIKWPYSRLEASPDYVEALIQLAADANWLPGKIPLPDHPPPLHPVIYYTTDPASGRPVPREDALIRADYVYSSTDGSRITQDEYILPWRGPDYQPSFHDINSGDWCAYYTLAFWGTGSRDRPRDFSPDEAAITYHWIEPVAGIPVIMRKRDRILFLTPFGDRVLTGLHFSPNPPSREDILRLRRTKDQVISEMLGST